MPVIKQTYDLRNKANEISELAHKSSEPIFITKSGEGDMVVMSILNTFCREKSNREIRMEIGLAGGGPCLENGKHLNVA